MVGRHSVQRITAGARRARVLCPRAGLKQDIGEAIGLEIDLVMKESLKRRIGQQILSEVVMVEP
jgi:predicted nucleotidyltransferase